MSPPGENWKQWAALGMGGSTLYYGTNLPACRIGQSNCHDGDGDGNDDDYKYDYDDNDDEEEYGCFIFKVVDSTLYNCKTHQPASLG